MPSPQSNKKVVFLSSITSDIGIALAKRYANDGYTVCGTYRSKKLLAELKIIPDCHLLYCDLEDINSIRRSVNDFAKLHLTWETFISLAAWPPPLKDFFQGDFEQWSRSVHINAIEQFRVLHSFHPYRDTEQVANVVFFAGPGTNNPARDLSALTVSKIMMIKMCELLDDENEDLNVFTVGPGLTKTKTHEQIMNDPDISKEKYEHTKRFVETQAGTSMDDIYRSIRWLCKKGKTVASGRNFSIVHDLWGKEELAIELARDHNMYKLRRYKNYWKDKDPAAFKGKETLDHDSALQRSAQRKAES